MSRTGTLHGDEFQLLRQRVSGSVSAYGDKQYDEQRTPWLEVVDQNPLAIVNAQTVQDIVETIRFARERNLPLAVQNTGHGIARPCNGGILLRLAKMKDIKVDATARTAIAEPGVQSGELLAEIEPFGFAFPTGQVSM